MLLEAISPFGVQVDDFAVDNENSPGPQETHVRRIYELLSNMGVHVRGKIVWRIRVSRKNCLTSYQSLQLKNKEEHQLRESTTIEGYPDSGGFSITVGEFGKGHLKHNMTYKAMFIHANQT